MMDTADIDIASVASVASAAAEVAQQQQHHDDDNNNNNNNNDSKTVEDSLVDPELNDTGSHTVDNGDNNNDDDVTNHNDNGNDDNDDDENDNDDNNSINNIAKEERLNPLQMQMQMDMQIPSNDNDINNNIANINSMNASNNINNISNMNNINSMNTNTIPTAINSQITHSRVKKQIVSGTKRAAQNRAAQKAFRQRRKSRIAQLEEIEASYKQILEENQHLKAENLLLKSKLNNN
ncbi:hypothetical protein DAPK24_015260 [Pichia kluyveri]|uniref:BZIP domain-containing protein n=1 Tax=Pichia kluyveri TaxID=36015 RepID=A0AAV5R2U6_PICKL|nr:hypothetical protein DAPK24_015260 [Pichia kluyveri]